MKFVHQTLCYIAILCLTSSCGLLENFPCESGQGALESEVREVEGFERIWVGAPADVYITAGTNYEVVVTAQENLLDLIETEKDGTTLRIDNDKCLGDHKTIRVDITLPELLAVSVKGSGDVFGQSVFTGAKLDLDIDGSGGMEIEGDYDEIYVEIAGSGDLSLVANTPKFESEMRGSGNLYLSGTGDAAKFRTRGSGEVNAFDFALNSAEVNISGSGDAHVNVSTDLVIDIRGSGDVFYRGNPTINVDINGSGEVKNAN